MKIKGKELCVVAEDIRNVSADGIVAPPSIPVSAATLLNVPPEIWRSPDESLIRRAAADALTQAASQRIVILAMPVLGVEAGFPLVGAAKILAQEVLRFARQSPRPPYPQEVLFCVPEAGDWAIVNKTVSGYIHHILEDLGQGPYVTVDAIIKLPDGIVIIERSNPPYGWALPGGFVDDGESLETAVIREVREETGLELTELRQFHTYSDPHRDPRFHTVSTVFVGTGVGTPQFGDDAKGLKVVPQEALLQLAYAFDHHRVLTEYLNGHVINTQSKTVR